MNTRETEVKEARLRRVLHQARPEPVLPPRFQESVWRQIEQRDLESERPESLRQLERLVTSLLRPRWAVALAAVLLLLGGVVGVMDGSADARQAARDQYVASVAPYVIR